MKIKASIQVRSVVGVILMFCGLQLYGQQTASGAEAAAKAATIITFDFPGSGGTEPVAINPAGTITGFYTDAMGITRGFLRAARHIFHAAQSYFVVFDAAGSLVGRIPSQTLRSRIIDFYIGAKAFTDALQYYEGLHASHVNISEYNQKSEKWKEIIKRPGPGIREASKRPIVLNIAPMLETMNPASLVVASLTMRTQRLS